MPKCIYCGATFSTAEGEHILQNSLGARWKSDQIVCSREQDGFGRTIDLELANRLKSFRNLFDHETGRGNPAPTLKDLPTLEGKKVALEPGGVLQLNQPEVKVAPHSDNARMVQILMRDSRDAGWALHLLKQQLPNAQIDEAALRQNSVPTRTETEDVVKLTFAFGGLPYLRAVTKAVFNLAAANGAPVDLPAFDAARAFVRDGSGASEHIVRFAAAHAFEPDSKLSPVDHFAAVATRGTTVLGYLQLYGALQYVLQLATDYRGPALAFGYLVNPRRDSDPAEMRQPVFSAEKLPGFYDQPDPITEATMSWMTTKLNAIVAFHQRIGLEKRVSEIVDDVLGPHHGKPLTPELLGELSRRVAELAAAKFGAHRPGI